MTLIERPYPWPVDAAHSVPAMICLEYKPTARARKWRVAYRMHEAGLDNMKADAPETSRQNGWFDWRIVREVHQ